MREIEHVRIYASQDGLLRILQDYVCHIVHWTSMLIQTREDVYLIVMVRSGSMLIIVLIDVWVHVPSCLTCLLIT